MPMKAQLDDTLAASQLRQALGVSLNLIFAPALLVKSDSENRPPSLFLPCFDLSPPYLASWCNFVYMSVLHSASQHSTQILSHETVSFQALENSFLLSSKLSCGSSSRASSEKQALIAIAEFSGLQRDSIGITPRILVAWCLGSGIQDTQELH